MGVSRRFFYCSSSVFVCRLFATVPLCLGIVTSVGNSGRLGFVFVVFPGNFIYIFATLLSLYTQSLFVCIEVLRLSQPIRVM